MTSLYYYWYWYYSDYTYIHRRYDKVIWDKGWAPKLTISNIATIYTGKLLRWRSSLRECKTHSKHLYKEVYFYTSDSKQQQTSSTYKKEKRMYRLWLSVGRRTFAKLARTRIYVINTNTFFFLLYTVTLCYIYIYKYVLGKIGKDSWWRYRNPWIWLWCVNYFADWLDFFF